MVKGEGTTFILVDEEHNVWKCDACGHGAIRSGRTYGKRMGLLPALRAEDHAGRVEYVI